MEYKHLKISWFSRLAKKWMWLFFFFIFFTRKQLEKNPKIMPFFKLQGSSNYNPKPILQKTAFSCPLCVPFYIFPNQDWKTMQPCSSAFHYLTPKPVVFSLIPGYRVQPSPKLYFHNHSVYFKATYMWLNPTVHIRRILWQQELYLTSLQNQSLCLALKSLKPHTS